MANIYDDQFKNRVEMHLLVCDPVSADIIFELRKYLDESHKANSVLEAERDRLTELNIELSKQVNGIGGFRDRAEKAERELTEAKSEITRLTQQLNSAIRNEGI